VAARAAALAGKIRIRKKMVGHKLAEWRNWVKTFLAAEAGPGPSAGIEASTRAGAAAIVALSNRASWRRRNAAGRGHDAAVCDRF